MKMDQVTLFPAADTAALRSAAAYLQKRGCQITDAADSTVTHLLLPVPSLDAQGYIKGSGADLGQLLQGLSEKTVVIGGNLDGIPLPRDRVMDLLKDEDYVAQNAAITAHCAIKAAFRHTDRTFQDLPVLVIGWGRIGKCLARLLWGLNADVTVAARKKQDRAILGALGYNTLSISQLSTEAARFDAVFNTAPQPVLDSASCSAGALLMELASSPGITGDGVIDARGLPGKEAPRSSGELIGKTVLRLAQGKEKLT